MKLDRGVYLELTSAPANLQRSLAICLASAIISLIVVVDLFSAAVDYVVKELPLITQMLIQSGASEQDISNFNEAISLLINQPTNFYTSLTGIAGEVLIALLGLAIQVGVIYLVINKLLRRQSRWQDILVVVGFSSIPVFFMLPSLFASSVVFKAIIILTLSLFALLTLGSGLKQVNSLRNVETVLVVLASLVVPNILAPLIGF